jgi:Domain of unknown function (DUF4118)
MELAQQIAAQQIGGLRGLVTVLGTLAFVGLLFLFVELIDRRSGAAAAPTAVGRVASDSGTYARSGTARPLTAGTDATSDTVVDLDADIPADDVWPLRSGTARTQTVVLPSSTTSLVSAVVGSILAMLVALVLVPVRSDIGLASIALALVLVVVGAAAMGGRIAAAVTSAAAALSFNFLHTAPLYTFHIAETSNIVTSVLMIVIGISVGEVAVRTFRSRPADPT